MQGSYTYLAAALLAALAGGLIAWRLRGWWRVFHMKRRFRRGHAGEQRAERLLKRHGFNILAAQLTRETGLWIDGQWTPATVRADFLAEKQGRCFVVEVKTGKSAPNPASSATRRQLFEYSHVYDADGVILCDMEANRLHHIRFGRNSRKLAVLRVASWSSIAFGAAIGLVLGLGISRLFAGPN